MNSNLRSVIAETESMSDRLDVTAYSKSSYNSSSLTPETFEAEYRRRFPNSVLFTEFNVHFQTPRNCSSTNIYYSSKVCYIQQEQKTCSGALYTKPKRNTYTLCPICDPFTVKGLKPHMEKRQGEQLEFCGNEPRFYDTLHSKYDHHMNHVHGVYKDSTTAVQPMLVLEKDKTNYYYLNSLCPMTVKGEHRACCWMNKVNMSTSDNPLKAYMRHYTNFHNKNGGKIKEEDYYKPTTEFNTPNVLHPIDYKSFTKALETLKSQCSQEPEIYYSRHPYDTTESDTVVLENSFKCSEDVSQSPPLANPDIPQTVPGSLFVPDNMNELFSPEWFKINTGKEQQIKPTVPVSASNRVSKPTTSNNVNSYSNSDFERICDNALLSVSQDTDIGNQKVTFIEEDMIKCTTVESFLFENEEPQVQQEAPTEQLVLSADDDDFLAETLADESRDATSDATITDEEIAGLLSFTQQWSQPQAPKEAELFDSIIY